MNLKPLKSGIRAFLTVIVIVAGLQICGALFKAMPQIIKGDTNQRLADIAVDSGVGLCREGRSPGEGHSVCTESQTHPHVPQREIGATRSRVSLE